MLEIFFRTALLSELASARFR